MDITTLKNELHQLIENTQDQELLTELYQKISAQKEEADWWEDMDATQQQRVLEAEKQFQDGEVVSNETVLKKIQEWLIK